MTLEEINETYGKAFEVGCEIMAMRGHKTPHIGTLVSNEDHWLKLSLDGEDRVYPAVYDPGFCFVIKSKPDSGMTREDYESGMNEARPCPHCGSVSYSLLRNGLVECCKCGKQDWIAWWEIDQ